MKSKTKFYINGEWIDPVQKNQLEVINPSNEDVCAIISLGGKADTDAAVEAAKAGQSNIMINLNPLGSQGQK